MDNFTSDQLKVFKTLVGMVHPDKLSGFSEEIMVSGEYIAKYLNSARDKGIYTSIRRVMELVTFYKVTKSSPKGLVMVASELRKEAATEGPKRGQEGASKAQEEPTLDPEIVDKAKDKAQEKDGIWGRSELGAWLLLEFGLKGKSAKVYLDEVYKKGESGVPRGEFARFLKILESGYMDTQAWNEWLSSTTENNRNHRSQFEGIRNMANQIHTNYRKA